MNRYSPAIMRRIVERAAADHGIGVERMLARTFSPTADKIAKAARIAAIKAGRERGYSTVRIGLALGGRDHSTILTAMRGAGL